MRLVGKYILVVSLSLALAVYFINPVVAKDVTSIAGMPSSPTPSSVTVDYSMPYPGLLPDHPFYFLKAFRDRVLAFLISNPVKKADFDLLQSDKRIAASYLLVSQEKKIDLAQITFSKGENYFDETISQVRIAKQEGNDMRDFAHKLALANKKHEEILQSIKRDAPQQQQQFEGDEKRLDQFEKTVKALEK